MFPLFPSSESDEKLCVLCRDAERGSDFCFVEFPAGLSGGLLQIESKTLSMSTIHLPRFCSKAATVPQFDIDQYCQTRNINILTRVCRELTRLSRSKHTLVKILTIGQLEHP